MSEKEPLLTIGIPFYNSRGTILDAIRSIFAQTFHDWELILVDDGSTDGAVSIARSVRDTRVRVLSDGENRGLAARLNQIASLARGMYIGRMDADDLSHPKRLAEQVNFLQQHPEVDVVGTAIYSVSEEGMAVAKRGAFAHDFNQRRVLRRGALMHATVMGERSWFTSNPYDPSFIRAEDRELWCRTVGTSSFALLPQPLYFYCEHGSFSLQNYARSKATTRRILRRYGPGIVGRGVTELLILREWAGVLAYGAAACVGCPGTLIRRRNISLSVEEAREAGQALEKIHATKIPGIDA